MANEKRTLDENGVLYLWNKVKNLCYKQVAHQNLPAHE